MTMNDLQALLDTNRALPRIGAEVPPLKKSFA
jgi:hypothetical protein